MYLGFILASYSVVGNDTIQTLGTFLSSNERKKWWVLWLFSASILTFTLVYGWVEYQGDVSYGRLEKYPLPVDMEWYYILPPLILLLLTRTGIPVSTSFLILTFFNEKNLGEMVSKSLKGYCVAFAVGLLVYLIITKSIEQRFLKNKIKSSEEKLWTVLQWSSTGFLWSQWLIQDFANIYVYLPRDLSLELLVVSLVIILSLLAYIMAKKGGAIQKIVKAKTNTIDVRSATIIDATYGIILYYFKELSNIPMSTTWVFIGLLAGREIGINLMMNYKEGRKQMFKMLGMDLLKISFGLIISIVLVYVVKWLAGGY